MIPERFQPQMSHDLPARASAGLHRPALEAVITSTMILLTLIACVLFSIDMVRIGTDYLNDGSRWSFMRLLVFTGIVLVLIYGNLVYQVARLGHALRQGSHLHRPFEELVGAHWDSAPPVVILVPSYKEDLRTIRQTLLSAALQHYPRRRVVLLLDDPPNPSDPEDAARLAAARRVPAEITGLLRGPAQRVERSARRFLAATDQGHFEARKELSRLLDVYADLVAWAEDRAAEAPGTDHTDELFVTVTFRDHAALLRDSARRLVRCLPTGGLSSEDLSKEYRRLSTLFRVEVTSFERKRYRNLSHEPNKAMNLNSYIGLLGKNVEEVRRDDGLCLEVREDDWRKGGEVIADATYVLTLDADSLLMPDYALRMVDVMERPANERLAVVQTPYTAIPNQPGVLERIAGATTDMQYIVHQGFSWVGATFWVGANALLRKAALDDIRTESNDDSHAPRFIQDRTVIEDTESTIDLVARGWWLHNYSERLAYSATPPDFGALLVQRHRWANGGLLIVPKLIRYAFTGQFHTRKPAEVLMRFHYLVSIAAGSIGFLILVLVPLDQDVHSVWLPITAVPYFLLYWRDLVRAGYRKGDILRVYAFNVMLMPINLAGATKSIQQAVTGKKTPFGRTPKVEGRTSAPAWAILVEWLLLAYSLFAFVWDSLAGRWLHAMFSLATVVTLAYVLVVFIGLRAGRDDVLSALRRFLDRKPAARVRTSRSTTAPG